MATIGARLPRATRKVDRAKEIDERQTTTLPIAFGAYDAACIRRLSEYANLTMKETAARLLHYALEKLAADKKGAIEKMW